MNRQLDRDMMQNQNNYIDRIETIETLDFSPTKITISDPFQEDVMKLLAVTLSLVILNKFRNKEILRSYRTQSKNQCETAIHQLFDDGKDTTSVHTLLDFIGLKGDDNVKQ